MLTEVADISTVFIAHVSGYVTGVILYAMLLGLVFRSMREAGEGVESDLSESSPQWLSLWAGILGLAWNVGALLAFLLPYLHLTPPLPGLYAMGVAALGFLPAVVVLAMVQTQTMRLSAWVRRAISIAGFLLSGWAAWVHLGAGFFALSADMAESALDIMVGGFLILLAGLLAVRVWTEGWDRMGGIVVFAGLAIAALPFSQHQTGEYSWGMELVGHHANLLLALAILYQDFRFALGDLFLKRALSFLALALMTLGILITVGIPMLEREASHGMVNISRLGVFLALWIATALIYPYLRRAVIWLVDVVVLRRPDYEVLRQKLAVAVNQQEEPQAILDTAATLLQPALLASNMTWREVGHEGRSRMERPSGDEAGLASSSSNGNGRHPDRKVVPNEVRASGLIRPAGSEFLVLIPTVETPQYVLVIEGLLHGRRLLSDDLVLLEAVAHLVARRIDAVRSAHERCAVAIREEEMKKLTMEAELRALRTQLNPHFLFNALTTIGYLIQTAPAQALETLMRLTELLRAVLKRLEGEFSTLGQEVDLVQSYLMIEQARFEHRLVYHIDVPSNLRDLSVPALVLQPLVENAVKHGIQKSSKGGIIKIGAQVEVGKGFNGYGEVPAGQLVLTVHDTGRSPGEDQRGATWGAGIGLTNIQKRLHLHYGHRATFQMHRTPELGTIVHIRIPVYEASRLTGEPLECLPLSKEART